MHPHEGTCTEIVTCTPETCPYGQKGWKHAAHCIKHRCVHDFGSGPWIEFEDGSGGTASCECRETAYGHSMRYAP